MPYRPVPVSSRLAVPTLLAVLVPLLALLSGAPLEAAGSSRRVKPVPPPKQVGELLRAQLAEATSLIRAGEARGLYGIDGTGLTAAVLDTGIRSTHDDFDGKLVAQVNYTGDNGGSSTNAADGDGHGTHVSGIIAANGPHTGIAPGARIASLKVLDNSGSGDFNWVQSALDWVIANRQTHNITVVNLSLGDGGNYLSQASDSIVSRLRTLRSANVAVCVAAGNDFYTFGSQQGMGYPAIFPETISVGAVYDANVGGFSYGPARANTTGPDHICPFSQRLHESSQATNRTDIFAPGAPITSAGITSDSSSATAHGTSQATPVISGVILLMQQYYQRQRGSLPTVDQLEKWLRAGAVANTDGDNEDDNVTNTGLVFPRVDVVGAMQALEADLNTGFSISGTVTLGGTALAGVTVTAGGASATTAADGRYTLSGLSAGTYTVSAARTNYLFSPTSRSVTVGPSATGVDFTATQTAFSISGTVTAGGVGLSGVTMTAGNNTTTTNAQGQYTFSGLGSGTYTVIPVRSGYIFAPVSRIVTVGPDQTGIDFSGTLVTYAIRGAVTLNGAGVSGVSVSAGGATALTDGSGAYTLTGLVPGTYTVAPSRSGFAFSPGSRSVALSNANVTGIDFSGSRTGYTLQGTITTGSGGLAGVTVAAGGRTATTDSSGSYTLSNVPAGSQTIIPGLANHSFSPATRAVTVSQDLTGLNFTATALNYQIAGQVLVSGQGLAGITVGTGTKSTTTAGDGSYTLTGLISGSYTVTVAASGYSFSPATRSVSVGPSRTGINFTGQALYEIRGTVLEGAAGLSGVTVSTTGRTATTDAQGKFVLTGLTAGTHTVRVTREGYEFTPATRSVAITSAAVEGVNFAASAVPILVSLTPQKSTVGSRKAVVVTVLFSRKVSKVTSVTLNSSSSVAVVPKLVRVPRNRDRVTFRMRTLRVSSVERVTLSATAGGITRTTQVTVQPQL